MEFLLKNRSLNDMLEFEYMNSYKTSVISCSLNKYKGIVKWSVKRSDLDAVTFPNYKECHFSIGKLPFSKLRLKIFPCGKTKNSKNVLFSIHFESSLPNNSWCLCTVSLLNEIGEAFKSEVQSKNGKDLNVIDFESFTKDELKKFYVKDYLIIHCTINIFCNSYRSRSGNLKYATKESCEVKEFPLNAIKKLPPDAFVQLDKEEMPVNKALLSIEIRSLRILFNLYDDEIYKLDVCIRPEIFKDILNFVYSGNINFNGFKHACEVYDSAFHFKMDKLMAICSTYMITNLHGHNIFLAQAVAHKIGDEKLLIACYGFVKNSNAKDLTNLSMSSSDELK